MNKKIYISAVAAAMIGASLAGCADYLEPEYRTNDGKTADSQFSSDPQSMLNAAMMSLRTLVDQTYLYVSGTDLYTNQQDAHGDDPYAKYTLTPSESELKSYYSTAYQIINYANGSIYYSNEDGEIGLQARFVRDYCYYLLTQQFGPVPYVTEYIMSAATSYPRVPLSELYPALIEDLEKLASALPSTNAHDGKASQQAAKALLAKVCLAAGWDLQTTLGSAADGTYTVTGKDYFSKAAQYAEAAIGGVQLTLTPEEKWAPANEGNAEEIYSVQYDRNAQAAVGTTTKSGNSLQNAYSGYWMPATTYGYKQGNHYHVQSMKSVYLFEKGDSRFESTFMTTFYGYEDGQWGKTGYYAYYNASAAEKEKLHIGHRFFPWYVSTTEAEKEFAAKKDLYAQGNCANPALACVMGSSAGGSKVTKYKFNADGSYSKTTPNYDVHTGYGSNVSEGMTVKKWDDPATEQVVNAGNGYRDIVLLHVSDLYLVAAEAYLLAGQESEALAKVNAVRTRAGWTSLSSFSAYNPAYKTLYYTSWTPTSLDVILDERARELYAENQRWMDLRRTRQLVRYNIAFNEYITSAADMQNAGGEIKWYRPIPTTEIESNTGISEADQNPGY